MNVAAELSLLLAGQLALKSQFGQLVHARDVAVAEANRQQVFGRTARQLIVPKLDQAGQDGRLSVGAGDLGTQFVLLFNCATTSTSLDRTARPDRQAIADPPLLRPSLE